MDTVFSSLRFHVFCGVLIIAMVGAAPVSAQETANQATETNESKTSPISQEALDSLLAPIALYPDALLAQVLMAATYPMDVIEAARWQQTHPDLNGQALQEALAQYDWDPSVKSLVTVPQVLQQMNDAPRWMQDLGDVVLADQPRVMASVQTLRQKAQSAGSLASNDKQVVKTAIEDTSETRYITIAPASTQVVYVPVYDPYVVYGGWWWPTRPVYWGPPPGAAFSSGYFWGGRYYSSVALWGGFNWGGGVITINAPLYTNYYRRPPTMMGPHNIWWRPPAMYAPPVGGRYGGRYYYDTRPRDRGPYERYVNRPAPPASPPLYAPGPGRDPQPAINRPVTTSPSPPGREQLRLTTKPAPLASSTTDRRDDSRRASGRGVQDGNSQGASSTRQVRQPPVERNDRADGGNGFSSSGQEYRQGSDAMSRERR